jgi:glycosyltransferase involved in cell wall biosynthesis
MTNSQLDNNLLIIYICTFHGMGGTQEYTLMLAEKSLKLANVVLMMPMNADKYLHNTNFQDIGGVVDTIDLKICSYINSRNYLKRLIGSYQLSFKIKSLKKYKDIKKIIVHTNLNPVSFSFMTFILGYKNIYFNTFHDFGNNRSISVSYLINTLLFILGYGFKRAFIVPSYDVKYILVNKVIGLSSSFVNIVHTGINPIDTAFKQPNKPLRFGMIGRVEKAKAWNIWLEAINYKKININTARFCWYGGGSQLDDAVKLSKDLQLDSRYCNFYGPFKNLLDVLDDIDIFVLSSRWEGGCLPRSILEAMYRGVPCILPKLPSVLEAITDNECCIFYSPEDPASLSHAFDFAINNPIKMQHFAINALILAKAKHSSDIEHANTFNLYRKFFNSTIQ